MNKQGDVTPVHAGRHPPTINRCPTTYLLNFTLSPPPTLLGCHFVYIQLYKSLLHFTSFQGSIKHTNVFCNCDHSHFTLMTPQQINLLFCFCPSSSQANDCHPAITAHSKQWDHPTKENQWDAAFPIWIWIQEGYQHVSHQEVSIPPLWP